MLTRPPERSPSWSRRIPRAARDSEAFARARVLAPEILAIHSRSLTRFPEGAVVSGVTRTSTGLAVVMLAPVGGRPCAVIKLPFTQGGVRALERETAALAALHANDGLGRWRELVPCPLACGNLGRQYYRVDSALDGCPVLPSLGGAHARRQLLSTAAETIDLLHRRTATTVSGGPTLAERWVEVHLQELLRHLGRRSSLTHRLERLRHELHEALAGGTFSAGWIHGDYWLGNLLFDAGESITRSPTGIVDWEASAALELALHDVLHLVLYTRRLLTGLELGHIVRDLLRGGDWSSEERVLLDRHGGWRHDRSLSERHALLLYWLRHTAVHARQQSAPVGYRYRLWEHRNVLPVLAAL
jgi:aminoglycoside phosphotransferase (APT) family kinase protein